MERRPLRRRAEPPATQAHREQTAPVRQPHRPEMQRVSFRAGNDSGVDRFGIECLRMAHDKQEKGLEPERGAVRKDRVRETGCVRSGAGWHR